MLIEWRRYFSYWYSRRLTKAHELQRAYYLFPGYANCAHGRVRSLPDDDSRTTAERVICFRSTQTVPVAARNDRLTPQQRIVTRIIWDISRCPHGPVVTKFYCPAPHFYLPRDVGTCLSLSPEPSCRLFMRRRCLATTRSIAMIYVTKSRTGNYDFRACARARGFPGSTLFGRTHTLRHVCRAITR